MIELAHNCAMLGIPFDSSRLLCEPPGNYELALRLVVERVNDTNRKQAEQMEQQTR